MNLIKKFLAHLGVIELAWIKMYDGEIHLRRVYRSGFGKHCYSHGLGIGCTNLLPDGKTDNTLVTSWIPYLRAFAQPPDQTKTVVLKDDNQTRG